MYRTGSVTAFMAAVVLVAGSAGAADDKKTDKHKHGAHNKCARECLRCAEHCESCARHCAHMLGQGKKEQAKSMANCLDCAEFCIAAGRIVARHGPMANAICESCAKACDRCAQSCEEHSEDEHMKACAKSCRDCAKACREMLEHSEKKAKRT